MALDTDRLAELSAERDVHQMIVPGEEPEWSALTVRIGCDRICLPEPGPRSVIHVVVQRDSAQSVTRHPGLARRTQCVNLVTPWERIWERNAAERPRRRGMRCDCLDGREVVTCRFETCEATGDGDRLAHKPEVASAESACPWTEKFRERRSTARWRVDVRLPLPSTSHVRKARIRGRKGGVVSTGRV
jgi:hypothetical protein